MRLIDADAIPESATAISESGKLYVAWSAIVSAPTIEAKDLIRYTVDEVGRKILYEVVEAETVKHAHWIIDEGGDWAECSRCHEDEKIAVLVHKDYCPACGSIMDEEDKTNGR